MLYDALRCFVLSHILPSPLCVCSFFVAPPPPPLPSPPFSRSISRKARIHMGLTDGLTGWLAVPQTQSTNKRCFFLSPERTNGVRFEPLRLRLRPEVTENINPRLSLWALILGSLATAVLSPPRGLNVAPCGEGYCSFCLNDTQGLVVVPFTSCNFRQGLRRFQKRRDTSKYDPDPRRWA